jgi:hypothetical protein
MIDELVRCLVSEDQTRQHKITALVSSQRFTECRRHTEKVAAITEYVAKSFAFLRDARLQVSVPNPLQLAGC